MRSECWECLPHHRLQFYVWCPWWCSLDWKCLATASYRNCNMALQPVAQTDKYNIMIINSHGSNKHSYKYFHIHWYSPDSTEITVEATSSPTPIMKLIIAGVWIGLHDWCIILAQVILETISWFLSIMRCMCDYAIVQFQMNKPGTKSHDDK